MSITLISGISSAEEPEKIDRSLLTIDRIYKSKDFDSKPYSARWLDGKSVYTTLAPSSENKDQKDILRHDAVTGKTEIMVAASKLIPPGQSLPLKIENYSWSKDQSKLLVYTNSKRVWRKKTRGDYWILDCTTHELRKLGGDSKPATMMFAKLSPNGQEVAYVRDRNIYVENLLSHRIRCLTKTGSDEVINGTTDWAYEEEFQVRDGFRWSPDSTQIAYWQINTEGVKKFPLINNTDSLYPTVFWFSYPKTGQQNPSCRIGIVNCLSGKTNWMNVPGDPRDHYIPRMQWAANSNELLIQQLNRLQNRNQLFMADASTGDVSPLLTEEDKAWVDIHDELYWLADGSRFTWISDRDGWRHAYLVSRSGDEVCLLTPGEFDVIKLLHLDEDNGLIYFIASPVDATQRFLYRARIDGSGIERVTPENEVGVHDYKFSENTDWAIHSKSTFDQPTTTELISISDHQSVRMLNDNEQLMERLSKLSRIPTEFFRIDIGDNVQLDGWCIKPPDFDPAKKYPLLIYVYGEPAGSTVINRWGGSNYLWHLMLAQQGYVVMSFDNRGTKAPRGRAWRKSVYRKIGILPPQDQAAAVRTVLKERPYIDPDRVGIWGWSGGGSSSLQAIFKYSNLYSTAIAVAPVPNQRYYDTIYQERYMGIPGSNVEGYREGSAINFAKQLKGNLLLVHGTADDNCHYQTVEMLIDELVAHNKQFSLMAYPNRTHAVKERKNTSRHLRELMTRFLLQHLPTQTSIKKEVVKKE
ncbi:MAG: DPP IV N-terminal domain-containing protein [Gimesia sp.]|nr:DPP IV N-terminal domain-containing protein [Gimesia sp.]